MQITDLPQGTSGFGRRLQWLRDRKHISRQTLADFVLSSKASITRYERGERLPDIETAARIAEYFEVSLNWLIGKPDCDF